MNQIFARGLMALLTEHNQYLANFIEHAKIDTFQVMEFKRLIRENTLMIKEIKEWGGWQ